MFGRLNNDTDTAFNMSQSHEGQQMYHTHIETYMFNTNSSEPGFRDREGWFLTKFQMIKFIVLLVVISTLVFLTCQFVMKTISKFLRPAITNTNQWTLK